MKRRAALCVVVSVFLLWTPLAAAWGSWSYTDTRYPIVLCHGMAGFDSLFGVIDYWYGIPSALASGGAEVYVTQVSAFNSPEARGEQLLAQVEYIVALSGAAKVNLVAHSHGGMDVRYVAAVRPDLVASVTTVASPHQGADLADFLREHVTDGSFNEGVLALFADSLGLVLNLLTGADNPQDAVAALDSVTSDGMAVFNARYPAGLPSWTCGHGSSTVAGVRYYSWSGARVMTNFVDPIDYALGLASLTYDGDNDGLIGRCSSHLGWVIRDDYRHNHGDEINQLLGLNNWWESSPKSIFRAHANRLKNAGL